MLRKQHGSYRMLLSPIALSLTLAAAGCAHKGESGKAFPTPIQPAVVQPAAPPPPPPSTFEQPALDRLKQMSETLSAAQSITFKAHSSGEFPAKTGQFLTYFAESSLALKRPNRLRAEIGGDLPHFVFYYNGHSIAAFDPAKKLYATTDAPDNLDAMLPFAMEKTGITFPTADFMVADPYQALTKDLTHAIVVGPAQVNGIACEHFAFMNANNNWEIWIESGKNALPRRLAVTYKDVPNFPRFVVELSDWNLKPRLSAGMFDFSKPEGAKQVEFGTQMAAPGK